jgi:glycosyltransferase involved in cell wall biosynthesis
MRLLILTPEYEGSGGGIMTFYQALIPALQAQGVEVRVIEGSACHTAADKSLRCCGGAWVETLEISRVHRWHARFGRFAATPGLRRHLAAAWAMWEQASFGEEADIVEACDWGLLFVPAALDGAPPLVVQCHGSIGQIAQHDPIAGEETQTVLTRLLERSVMAGVLGGMQTLGCANATWWRQETGSKVQVIRPAWISPPIQPTDESSDRGLVVGRVQRWKGPQTLCAAFDLLSDRALGIDWVGRDTSWGSREHSASTHLSRKYPMVWGKKVVHYAPVPAEQVSRRQAGALFNLVPSTWDVFNFTAVEAMASGRPTIISTGAGASELIEDGVNGYTFPSGDAKGLAATIDKVLSASPGQLADVGLAAQATVRRVLDPPSIAAQRVAAYRSTIDAFGECHGPSLYGSLGEICRPTDHAASDDASFLDQVPLRTLMRHVAGRLGKKAVSSSRVWQATQ